MWSWKGSLVFCVATAELTRNMSEVRGKDGHATSPEPLVTCRLEFWSNSVSKFTKQEGELGSFIRCVRTQKLKTGKKKGRVKIQICIPEQGIHSLFWDTMTD